MFFPELFVPVDCGLEILFALILVRFQKGITGKARFIFPRSLAVEPIPSDPSFQSK